MKSPLHPSDEEAVQTIDAMIHGDVTSSKEKYDYISEVVARWTRLLNEAGKNPHYLMVDEDENN